MSTYRTEYRDRDRDRDRDRERRYDRDPCNYHDRRDGERDRRDRDYDRGTRDRGSRDRDIDRTDRREASSKTTAGTATRPPLRTLSSPSHKSGASTGSSPLSPPPRKPPTALTTPTSSAPSTPRFSDGSTHLGKIAEALRTVSKRSYEHVSIQLRKDVVEARAKEREQNRKMLQQKYTEFPSLREAHRKSEKKDLDDLAALRKNEQEADKRTLATTEQLASTLFQILSELQLDKDRQAASKDALNAVDSLEARISARLGALEAKHREDAERQEKRIEELTKGISAETTQRRLLSAENESLKAKLRDVESRGQAYRSLVDEHTASIKQMQTAKVDDKTTQATPNPSVQAQYAAELQTLRGDFVDFVGSTTYLYGKVAEHDTKLGELDVELINESCDAIVTRLPRFEQNVKKATEDVRKATEDVFGLRTDSEQLQSQLRSVASQSKNLETLVKLCRTEQEILRSKMEKFQTNQQFSASSEKLDAGVEQLRSDFRQLNSEMEKIQTSQQSSAETEQLKAGVEQLQSDVKGLKSEIEELREGNTFITAKEVKDTFITRKEVKDTFITMKEVKTLNGKFVTLVGGWVEDLRAKIKHLQDNEAQRNPNPDDGQTPNKTSAVIEYAYAIQLNEQKLHEHDERIRVLESSAQAQEQSAKVSREEERGALEKNQAAFKEATLDMIETMKTQVAMSEQSLKSLSESVKLMTDNQSAHTGRLGEVESEVLKLGTRLEGSEQSLRSAEQKFEKRMDLVQHNYTNLDSQMNNLTTEGLFQAIIRHLDKYQPSGAQLGQKVDTIIQQVNQHEHRLVKVERSSSASEAPVHKKRKYSPNGYAMTNGVR